MDVRIIAHTNTNPLDITAHAAKTCYMSKEPEMGAAMDVENALFKVGHHTTLQHFYITFAINNVAIGDIKLGLHMCSPFYNSDERSGRYCAKIFDQPKYDDLEGYIRDNYKEITDTQISLSMKYIKGAMSLYETHMPAATKYAEGALKLERPLIRPEVAEKSSPKIAMEQMRVFIPAIFPTGLDYTVNLTALAAMQRTAWTPGLRTLVDKMVVCTVEMFPELSFIFQNTSTAKDWAPELKKSSETLLLKPRIELISVDKKFVVPDKTDTHPLDLLHFSPKYMDNNVGGVHYRLALSLATMGQDQRHRTIRRSVPAFTGEFYLPPICAGLGLGEEAKALLNEWLGLASELPTTLHALLAPFGAVLTYEKWSSYNSLIHEQAKRLCWCAQEEIYHVATGLRREIFATEKENKNIGALFEPECYSRGTCAEGDRFCGRKISVRKTGDYFPDRVV